MIPNESSLSLSELKRRSDWRIELYNETSSHVIDPGQFLVTDNSIFASSGNSGFSVGDAICRSIQLRMVAGSNENCLGKTYVLRAVLPRALTTLNGETTDYKVDLGRFTITEEQRDEDAVSLKGYDAMMNADIPYLPKVNADYFSMRLEEYFMRACDVAGIDYDYITDPAGNKHIENLRNVSLTAVYKHFRGMTCREVLASVAAACGGNVIINRNGKAEFVTYARLSGSTTSITYVVDNALTLKNQSAGKIITGVIYNGDVEYDTTSSDSEQIEAVTVILGTDGYVVDLSGNPFFALRDSSSSPRPEYWQSVIQDWLSYAYEALYLLQVRSFECTIPVNPLIEFMDPVEVYDKDGSFFYSYITDLTHTALGTSVLRNSAEYASTSGTSSGSLGGVSGSGASSAAISGIRQIMFNGHVVSVENGIAYINEADPTVSEDAKDITIASFEEVKQLIAAGSDGEIDAFILRATLEEVKQYIGIN